MRSLQIFKIWGIPFKIHPYWFAILFFFSWSTTNQINFNSNEIYNVREAWLIGFLTSFFFLASIIFQEIFHTFVSLNHGVKIKTITFYFLGAIFQVEKDCQTAIGNIKIALVRPLLCFGTSSIFLLIRHLSENKEQLLINIIFRIALLNLFLGFLNLIPVGSSDGGNLLKSIIWYFSGSKNKGRSFLIKTNLSLSILILILGIISLFGFNFFYGIIFSFIGLFGINSSKSESQFIKIENIIKFSKVSDLKLKPLRKIEYDANFLDLDKLVKNKKESYEKFLFITKDGRWKGFINENILKSVSIKKWERTFVWDFKNSLNSFNSVYNNTELWKTIESIEKTSEGFLLVLNAADIPLGIIDRNKIGFFVLNKLGLNLPNEIISKFNNKNEYPLGINLPKLIYLMKKKGDID